MLKGKTVCKTLKEIRLRVAESNGIEYRPADCYHQGPCDGTCPRCEQEVRYIEHELRKRSLCGQAATIAGVAAGLALPAMPTEAVAQSAFLPPIDSITRQALQQIPVKSLLKEGEKGVVIRGQVVEKSGDPVIGAAIVVDNTSPIRSHVSDINGMFAVEVPEGSQMKVIFIGYKDFLFTAKAQTEPLTIVLEEDENLMGEVVTVGFVCERDKYDDVYGRKTNKTSKKKTRKK